MRQATAGENESNHLENLESGDMRAINIVNDEQNLLERLLAEEQEKIVLETAIENKIPKKQGIQYWEEKGRTYQLIKSVYAHSTYLVKRSISR